MSTLFDDDGGLQSGMSLKLIRITRLKQFASARGLIGPSSLGDAIGKKANQTSDLLSGKASFGEKVARSIEEHAGLPQLWLDTVSGESNTEPGPELRGKVPLISWVQAGAWCQATEPHTRAEAERWMDCPVSHSPGTFALRVRGDSMTAPHGNSRSYPEGCYIFVDPERREPTNGDRVVACLSGTDEVTFKVYKNEDGRQWLQPLNPSHEPIREKFHILGAVIGKWEDE